MVAWISLKNESVGRQPLYHLDLGRENLSALGNLVLWEGVKDIALSYA